LTGDPFDLADYDRHATEEENTTALFYVEALNSDLEGALPAEPVVEGGSTARTRFGFSAPPGFGFATSGAENHIVMVPVPEAATPNSPPWDDEAKAAQERNARLAAARRAFLEANAESLRWMLSATQREHCVLRRPSSARPADMPVVAREASKLAALLLFDGQLAEYDGKLDVALDRYLRVRRFAQHIAKFGNCRQCLEAVQVDNMATSAIVAWADRPGQSNELLERALEAVRAKPMVDLLADAPKTEYLIASRAIESGSVGASVKPSSVDAIALASAGASRFPWERARQLRLLRLAAYWAMHFPQGTTANLRVNSPWSWLRREPLSNRPNQALRQLIGDSSYAQYLVVPLISLDEWAGGRYVNVEHHLHNAIERTRYGTNAGSAPSMEPASEGFGE
jgi:hypothetical protein